MTDKSPTPSAGSFSNATNPESQKVPISSSASDYVPITPEKKSGFSFGTLFLGCIIGILLLVACCCGSFFLVSAAGPGIFMSTLVTDKPLNIQTTKWPEPEIVELRDSLSKEISEGTTVLITPEELTQIFLSGAENSKSRLNIDIDNKNRTIIDASINTDKNKEKYLNLQAILDVEIENGSFTKFYVYELKVGKYDLSKFFENQDLSANFNQQINTSTDPDLKNFINSFENLKVEDGKFLIKIDKTQTQFFQNPEESVL